MKEEVRWLIGIGVILAGLILNLQRVDGNRMDRLEVAFAEHRAETSSQIARVEDALAEHRAESAMEFNRLDEILTGHRVEAAREFGEIKSSLDFLLTVDPPGEQ